MMRLDLPTAEDYRAIRSVSERLGLQHSHLVDRQLVSHAQRILEVTRGVKTDRGVHARLCRQRVGRGAHLATGDYDLDSGLVRTRRIEAVTELRELVPEREPLPRRTRPRRKTSPRPRKPLFRTQVADHDSKPAEAPSADVRPERN